MFTVKIVQHRISRLLVLVGLLAILISACSQTKETIIEREPRPLSTPQDNGTIDGGGGSGIDGKPLESYIKNVRELAAYKNAVLPIVEKLGKIAPRVAADFAHLSRERTWYYIPVNLDSNPATGLLPPWKIGTYFQTDLLAIQNLREVWFNSLDYDKMEEKDQTLILLHEFTMGMRLMKHQGSIDRCIAEAARKLFEPVKEGETKTPEDFYLEERGHCRDVAPTPAEDHFGLTKDDYANVRKLTNLLYTKIDELDGKDLIKWLYQEGFRSYPGETLEIDPDTDGAASASTDVQVVP